MSDLTEDRNDANQPMYVVWVLLIIGGLSLFQIGVPIGLYCAVYGVPKFSDLFTNQMMEYSQSTLWKGRVWHLELKVGPSNLLGKGTLASFDPEKGDVQETQLNVPFPLIGMLPDGDLLWAVSSSSVTKIDGETATEFKPSRLLTRTSEPFLFENRLALIDIASGRQPTLLAFDGKEWIEAGKIAIPFGFGAATVEGTKSLVPTASNAKVGASLMDMKIIVHDGQFHLFVSDGSTVAYKTGLDLAACSALAPENGSGPIDLSDLDEWEMVCSTSAGLGRAGMGRMGATSWKPGMVDGQPIVITVSSSNPNPFQGNSLVEYRRVGDEWQKASELPTQALMGLMVVTDGQKTYVGPQTFVQTLRLYSVTDTEMRPTGAFLKAPVAPMQQPIERMADVGKWVYWPSLLLLGVVMSRLMAVYRGAHYQFGLTTVELASLTRRGIARIIDLALLWIPWYVLAFAFGMSSQEQVAENLDKIFDLGPTGMFARLAWLYLSMTVWAMTFLVAMSCLQGVWGVTLGKWICGIRTVRSTLRPCGFPRALLRELLLVVDTLLGISFIPVTLAIAFTSWHQRLGDMAADTIVIRKPKT